jgi:hypothetical protein
MRDREDLERRAGVPLKHPALLTQNEESEREANPLL